ncbi:43496_t:CDS:2 [Gigaspora margarita]|uniref:43496_t:CDS:1 n=1 Tax=Gigaspora margarita TaxID=4874 RepID=A0ABN7VP64_GIGMA|nr:43496_t:CDS:2 [Gigaspora margarita]
MPRTNATLACIYCQKRHEKCERIPEEHTCVNCKKRNHPCISVPGYKRGPKPRRLIMEPYPNINPYMITEPRRLIMEPFPNINPYETTETFQNTFIKQPSLSYSPFVPGVFMPNITLFPTNDLHSYNNTITTLPINPYETTKPLQNTFINQSSSYHNDEPELNNDQNITSSSDSFSTSCSNDSSFFETQHSYDNIITTPNIDPYGTIEAFQNSNNEQNITSSSGSFSTMYPNDTLFFETQHPYNSIITTTPNIDLYETIETFQDMFINQSPSTSPCFIHDELELNNEQNIISSSSSFSTGCSTDSFGFETQHSYNNIVTTTPNINPHGSVETFQNTFINQSSSSSLVHDEQMPNDE